jgi:hypothetical protein
MVKIVPVDQSVVDDALGSDCSDFEDAMQYFSAKNGDVDLLLIRKVVDYPKNGRLKVMTPTQFLKNFSSN